MSKFLDGRLAKFAMASAAAVSLTAGASGAVVNVADGDFATIDGATGRIDDIAAPWFEGNTLGDYSDYFLDPSTNTIGFGPQFPGWAGGGLAILEAGTPYLYQAIGTKDAAENAVQADWLHIKRTVTFARGVVVSVYSSAAPVVGADGSTLTSLGATLVGSVDVTAASLGFIADTTTHETKAASATINTSGVTTGHALYLEITPNGDNGGSQGAFLDDFAVSVPEPASMALLGLGGLLMLRRRRV